MAQAETDTVEREIRIRATPETVFSFLVDPMRMVEWFGTVATLDPRPGGVYRVEVNPDATARGEFVEIDPPRRVVFTFGWEAGAHVPPGSSTVEIELHPDGDETVLKLLHRGLPAESVEIHGQGWSHHLGQLIPAAEKPTSQES